MHAYIPYTECVYESTDIIRDMSDSHAMRVQ